MWKQEADSRETPGMLTLFRKTYPGAYVGELKSGDYNQYWLNDDGTRSRYLRVESKTLSDFLNSIRPAKGEIVGRLWSQMSKPNEEDSFVLLLRGVPSSNRWLGFSHWASYVGGLNTVARTGAVILPVGDTDKDAMEIIKAAFSLHQRAGGRFYSSIRPMKGVPWQQQVLAGFPNIGSTRAKMLLKRFTTIEDLVKADQEDLEVLLGKAVGGQLFRSLRTPL